MYDQTLLDELNKLESEIHFSSFDLNDAYVLGNALRTAGQYAPKPIAVRIVLDGVIAYQSMLPGTNATNCQWMDKKQRTVEKTHGCTLRAAVERELSGISGDWQKDDEHYAFCGGGFPLFVNGEYKGIAIVSGLPHLEDHKLLTRTLAAFQAMKEN